MKKAVVFGIGVGMTIVAILALTRSSEPLVNEPAPLGSANNLSTSRQALETTIQDMRRRVAAGPGDGAAAVLLADALMRQARVTSDASLPLEAERVLRAALAHSPADYPALRMLGVVYLAQHRFTQALETAQRAQRVNPRDGWNYAVAGDALLELGRYDEAFDAFDEVMSRRPDAAAYARVAYAWELQGDSVGAVDLMRMAAEATGPHDPEAQAWVYAQLGHLYFVQGQFEQAEREYARADFTFPGHPYARNGRVRLKIARGDLQGALALARTADQTPESLAIIGDLHLRLGDAASAEAAYAAAESMEREGWEQEQPQPAALARFFAERNRKVPEAVTLAERAVAERDDINTHDALAWSYFRAGRIDAAAVAIARAVRTGTADPRIGCHARAIAQARRGGAVERDVCDPLSVMVNPPAAVRRSH